MTALHYTHKSAYKVLEDSSSISARKKLLSDSFVVIVWGIEYPDDVVIPIMEAICTHMNTWYADKMIIHWLRWILPLLDTYDVPTLIRFLSAGVDTQYIRSCFDNDLDAELVLSFAA